MGEVSYYQRFVEETAANNDIVLGHLLPRFLWETLPHTVQTWLRNYLSSIVFYLVSNSLWCFYIYYLKRGVYVQKDAIPSRKVVLTHIYVSMMALPWLSASMTFLEYLIENGWTRCYTRVNEVGLVTYLFDLCIYLAMLEFCLYWTHRSVHDVKPLYKYFHVVHHKYNKPSVLSPFAGIALHPVDGVLNSLPYVFLPCIVPVHFTTQSIVMFIDGLWSGNIHDCIDGKIWPTMGAAYHTIHHTTHKHNYGHFTILMDWMFGTLRKPSEYQTDNRKME